MKTYQEIEQEHIQLVNLRNGLMESFEYKHIIRDILLEFFECKHRGFPYMNLSKNHVDLLEKIDQKEE